jgi:2-isopropylmalate synthase
VAVLKREPAGAPRAIGHVGLIHDWNGEPAPAVTPRVLDETLRDGLQCASARDPSVTDKVALLHAMVRLGVDAVTVGMPGAHERQREHALRLAREVARDRLPIGVACAARTRTEDIEPIADIAEAAGIPIEACVFIASSPIRQCVEGRTLANLLRLTERSVRFARDEGLSVMFVTEDSTRSTPEVLAALYACAIRAGAARVCIADTVGHATPSGAAKLVSFVARSVAEIDAGVRIDWHGHCDRGLAVANALAAWSAGAERCHGTALGLGERSGNAAMELLLVNLRLLGWIDRDLGTLSEYARLAARSLGVPIPANAPVVGSDAFRTTAGVHASVLARAARMGDGVRDEVYSAVPAAMVGRSQAIDVGPMSGRSNVRAYLAERGVVATEIAIGRVLQRAKAGDEVLSESEVLTAALPRDGEGLRRAVG